MEDHDTPRPGFNYSVPVYQAVMRRAGRPGERLSLGDGITAERSAQVPKTLLFRRGEAAEVYARIPCPCSGIKPIEFVGGISDPDEKLAESHRLWKLTQGLK